jgi:hypothetical protein
VDDDLLAGVDEFLDDSLVLPPGEVDNNRVLSHEHIMTAIKRHTVTGRRAMREKMEKVHAII